MAMRMHMDLGMAQSTRRRGIFLLEVFEDGVLPRFRLRQEDHPEIASMLGDRAATIETERPGGVRQTFHFADRGAFLESIVEMLEPHSPSTRGP